MINNEMEVFSYNVIMYPSLIRLAKTLNSEDAYIIK